MASTGAVPQFARRVLDVRVFALLVWPRLVVARMTTRTVGLECRILPGDELGVGLVTPGALQVAAMILWFVQ